MKKTEYTAPQIEVIELGSVEIMAGSVTISKGDDPIEPDEEENYWGD